MDDDAARSLEMDRLRLDIIELCSDAQNEITAGRDQEAITLLRSALAMATLSGDAESLHNIHAAIGTAHLRLAETRASHEADHLTLAINALRVASELMADDAKSPDPATMLNLALAYARRFQRDQSRVDLLAAIIELDRVEQAYAEINLSAYTHEIAAIRASLVEPVSDD